MSYITHYLVGGAVRDQLLAYPYHEKDWVVVGSTPEAMIKAGYTPVGKDFPVFLHPETKEEYALARTERKTAPGYKGFTFHTDTSISLEEDLLRRDLTINAMAMNESGDIIDPYDGQKDIREKYLRHVSPAFNEDPVRVLRIARFMARYYHLGFRIAEETLALMQDMVSNGETQALVAERVWQEMYKALQEPNPEQFFYTLHTCGALQDILPNTPSIEITLNSIDSPPASDKTGENAATFLTPLLSACRQNQTPSSKIDKSTEKKAMTYFSAFCFTFSLGDIPLICKKLSAPKPFYLLAERLKNYHSLYEDKHSWSTTTLSTLFQKCDAIRAPEAFTHLLDSCRAISGKSNHNNHKLLLEALQAYQTVDHQALIKKGFQKAELGKSIQEEREKKLTSWLTNLNEK